MRLTAAVLLSAAPLTADSRAAIAGVYKRAAAGLPKPE